MNKSIINTNQVIWIAMDIAKRKNDVLIEWPNGKQKKLKINNIHQDYKEFTNYLHSFDLPCVIALEATGNYHRPIAYCLQKAGFTVQLISSFAACKTREALHNSWDKNDLKDTRVICTYLKQE